MDNPDGTVNVKNVLRVFLAIFYTLTAYTIVGYQILLPVLHGSGVYSHLCSNETKNETHDCTVHDCGCTNSQLALDLMFTLATAALNCAIFASSLLILFMGSRSTCILGAFLLTIGAVSFGFSSRLDFFKELYTVAYIVMAFGGPLIGLPMLTLTTLFPTKDVPLLISLIVGASDGSAGVMWLFQILYLRVGWSMDFMFWGLGGISATLIFMSFFIFSAQNERNGYSILQNLQTAPYEQEKIRKMIFSLPFWLVTIWSFFYVLANSFYITTIDRQLAWITNDNKEIEDGLFVFSIILPCSIIFTPITSFILYKYPPHVPVQMMAFTSIIVTICSVIKVYPLQFFTMVIVVYNRFFFFVTLPFLLKFIFGPMGVGSLYGIALFFAVCFNYSNYLWKYLMNRNFDTGYIVINIFQNILCAVLGLCLSFYILK